jgi:RNA polymerase-binding transcription factor DksA
MDDIERSQEYQALDVDRALRNHKIMNRVTLPNWEGEERFCEECGELIPALRLRIVNTCYCVRCAE